MSDYDTCAPIILFIYNRPDHTQKTLEALQLNTYADKSDLYIFADGAKANATEVQLQKINETRRIAASKKWCKNVYINNSDINKGLAASIIAGVTEIINKYGKAIILEDDIVTGKYFLEYMNNALNRYENEKKVWHITGWRNPVKNNKEGISFFYPTMDCWGWATWSDRWQYYKKDVNYYKKIFTKKMIYKFNINGSQDDMWGQIEKNASGKINTWAIFWYATIFLHNGLCLSPTRSIVKNIGLDNSGEHCSSNDNQIISTDINFKIFNFPKTIKINKKEFNRNIEFFKEINDKKITFYKIKIGIKKIIKKIIPSKLYLFMKKKYHKS